MKTLAAVMAALLCSTSFAIEPNGAVPAPDPAAEEKHRDQLIEEVAKAIPPRSFTLAEMLQKTTLVASGSICTGAKEFQAVLTTCHGDRAEVRAWRANPGLPGWATAVLVGAGVLLGAGLGVLGGFMWGRASP